MALEEIENLENPLQQCCTTCQQMFAAEVIVCPDDGTVLTPIHPEQLVGTVFADRYEMVSIIGTGGMGKVYKSRHKLMRRMVAIKVVHPHLVSSTGTLTRFQQEAEAASRLNHPNIVTVHDFGLVPRAYLVMDYLDGTSLFNLLGNDDHFALDRSVRIFVQICAGLAHAHEKGVVHRDLKPSNIMLLDIDGQTDVVKIVDFGIAKIMLKDMGESKHLTAAGEIFGSPLYMSPEQCRAKAMDARSDVYSLGCIMYRTLTGHQPILGQELMECLYNHVNIVPKRFADICPELNLPSTLEAIVMKCMEKERENRFQSMTELKDALEALDQEKLAQVAALKPKVAPPNIDRTPLFSDLTPSEAAEVGRAALAAEASRVASAAEAGFAASAAEDRLAASAAESGRAASAAESARAKSAAEVERAASAAEAGRAASAAEAGRAASAAEAGRAACAHEAGLAAFAAEAGRVANAAETSRAASATEPGFEASAAEISFSASIAKLGRSVSAAEASRAASAAESARAASATEAGLAASATEAALAASAHEASLAASAHEASLAASAHEASLAASAAEAGRAASAHEAGRAASAAEAGRAACAAEAGRAASAAEADRAASVAEAGRVASDAKDNQAASASNEKSANE